MAVLGLLKVKSQSNSSRAGGISFKLTWHNSAELLGVSSIIVSVTDMSDNYETLRKKINKAEEVNSHRRTGNTGAKGGEYDIVAYRRATKVTPEKNKNSMWE